MDSNQMDNNQMNQGYAGKGWGNTMPDRIVCPYCGEPNFLAAKRCKTCGKTLPKKESGLGIAALICTLLGCTSFIGLILAIIDLFIGRDGKDGKGHICSKISIVCYVIFTVFALFYLLIPVVMTGGNNHKESTSAYSEPIVDSAQSYAETDNVRSYTETVNDPMDDVIRIEVGESFTTNEVTYLVKSVNPDYKLDSGESMFIDVPAGSKCIKITFSVTNNSDVDKYVSVGQFECYVDNVKYDVEFMGSDNYNDNIAPGRTAEVDGLWVIPDDASSIEVEYDPVLDSVERVVIVVK